MFFRNLLVKYQILTRFTINGIVLSSTKKLYISDINIQNDYNFGIELWYQGTIANDGTQFFKLKVNQSLYFVVKLSKYCADVYCKISK